MIKAAICMTAMDEYCEINSVSEYCVEVEKAGAEEGADLNE